MPTVLKNISINDSTELRQLILSSLETLFSSFQILDLEAPLPGEPILLLNRDKSLVILSFDLNDNGQALLNGLRASEKLFQEADLFKRLYPALKQQTSDLRESTTLCLLAPANTTDELGLGFVNEKISAYTFQGIEVNGETFLMIEPVRLIETPAETTHREINRDTDHETGQQSVSCKTSNGATANEATPGKAITNEDMPNEVAEMSTDEVLFFQQL